MFKRGQWCLRHSSLLIMVEAIKYYHRSISRRRGVELQVLPLRCRQSFVYATVDYPKQIGTRREKERADRQRLMADPAR